MDNLNDIKIIGHRGLAKDNVENTIQAVKSANKTCDIVELDIRQTKDGKYIIFHDDTLKRASGLNTPIKDTDYSTLKNHTIFKSKQKIPLISEVLNLCEIPILFEFKKDVDITSKLFKQFKSYDEKLLFQSFNPKQIRKINNLDVDYDIGLICPRANLLNHTGVSTNSITHSEKGLNFICELDGDFLTLHRKLLSEDIIYKCNKNNIEIYAWGLSKKEHIQEIIQLGIDGIIVDSLSILD
jgi:glycerophosphoryl diester phosphodiesterase